VSRSLPAHPDRSLSFNLAAEQLTASYFVFERVPALEPVA